MSARYWLRYAWWAWPLGIFAACFGVGRPLTPSEYDERFPSARLSQGNTP